GQRRDHAGKIFRLGGVDADNLRVRDRTSQNPRVRHARKLEIAGVKRFARDFFDAVDAVRARPRDRVAGFFHRDAPEKKPRRTGRRGRLAAYLRIFGLSFSGKYLSQNGQWKFIPEPSMCGLTTKIF